MNKSKFLYEGQALLIVLLSMAVVLVVVLSILARSVTDVSISSQDEDSMRAFSAAEAGVERALIIGSGVESSELGNASYSVNVGSFVEGSREYKYPFNLFSGESATVWFVGHDENDNYICSVDKPCFTGSNLRVCWGKEGANPSSDTTPAVEVTVFYTSTPGDYSTLKVKRAAVDPNNSRRSSNNFSAVGDGSCTIDGTLYPFYKYINFISLGIDYSQSNVLQFATIRLLYNTDTTSPIAFSTPAEKVLPSQGIKVESLGSSGEANRKIEVYKFFPQSAEIFQFGVYTGGYLIK